MERILWIIIISLAAAMVAGALTPADIVRDAVVTEKQTINVQGISASVFESGPFAKDSKRVVPRLNDTKGRNFTESAADESLLSENAAKEWIVEKPELSESTKESFHRDNITVAILGPVVDTIELKANDTNATNTTSNNVDDVIKWLNLEFPNEKKTENKV